jgi:hypothetical protein
MHHSTGQHHGKNQEVDGVVAHTPYFWTTIEKGINHYTEHAHKGTANTKDNGPQKPFGVTFNTSRSLLQQTCRTQ